MGENQVLVKIKFLTCVEIEIVIYMFLNLSLQIIKKQISILLIFCLLNLPSFAQIWVQPNAVWHYDFSNGSSGGFVKIEYIKDTLLDAKVSKMFLTTKFEFVVDQNNVTQFLGSTVVDSNYTWNNSDTVFYWKNNQFEILYDFTKTIGDYWVIGSGGNNESGCSSISTVEVLGENLVDYNGISYASFDLYSADSSNYKLRGKYNSRFGAYSEIQGSYNLIFPSQSWFCDSSIPDESPQFIFRCFEDDGLTYNPSGEDCEYLLTHLGIEGLNKSITISPNPFQSGIKINGIDACEKIVITDSRGTTIKEFFTINELNATSLEYLVEGIYFVQIQQKNNQINTIKILKN